MIRKLIAATCVAAVSLLGASNFALAAPTAPASVSVDTSKSLADTLPAEAVVEVTWTPHASAVAYSVSATASGQTTRSGTTATCTATLCSSTIGSLTGGVLYAFKVTAIASDGSQTAASAVNATPKSVSAAPGIVSAAATDGVVTLTWSAPSNDGGSAITEYTISDSGNTNKTATGDKTSLAITGLSAGTSYTFTIKAKNSVGSSIAASFAAVTAVSVPTAPTAPTVTLAGSSANVSWTAPAANGSSITGYKVYVIDSTGTDVGQPTAASGTSAALNLSAGTYTVKVVATNALGDSARSVASSSFDIASNGTLSNTPIFTPATLANLDIGSKQTVSAVAPSGGTVTIAATGSPTGACTYAAGEVTAVAAGTCTVTATVPANSTYLAGNASKTFTIKGSQTISFASIADQTFPGTLTLSASATSGLTVSFAASGACTVSNRTVTFVAAGQCSITASQAGSNLFMAASPINRVLTVSAGGTGGSSGGIGGGTGGGGSAGGGGGSTGGGGGSSNPINPKPSRPIVVIPSKPSVSPTTYFATTSSTAGAASARVSGSSASVSVKIGKPVYATLSGLKAGTVVVTKIKSNDGKIFVLSPRKVGSSKTFVSTVVKPKKAGTYAIVMTYGSTTKTLKITVRK